MLIILVLLTILNIVTMAQAEKLNYVRREKGWNEEVRFWGRTSCRAGRRRIFSLHEMSKNNPYRRLHDFFGDLVTDVQNKCGVTMSTKSYRNVEHTYKPTHYGFLIDDERDEIVKNPPIFVEQFNDDLIEASLNIETNIFPHRDVEILVMPLEDSVRILMDGFKNWDNSRYVLILMMTRKEGDSETSKLLADTFVILLQRLWKEHRVLNVFFAAPFSSLGHRIWFYDPFIKNSTTGLRGKIFALQTSSMPSVKRVMNLQGYPLNIGMFEVRPVAIKYDADETFELPFSKKSEGYVGMDGLTMTTIAKHMNFTVNIIPPSDGLEFGWVCDNGTFVGTIGDAAYHRIDISFNSMYWKIYELEKREKNALGFTFPIDFDRLCVVVPRARKIPRWLRTFYYFQPAIWACIVVTQIIVALVWYILRNIDRNLMKQRESRTSYWSLLHMTFFLFIGAPVNVRTSSVERIILAGLLLFGLTIVGTFTGTLYHSFTNEMHYKEIDTLKELDASGITVATASPNLQDAFGPDETIDDVEEVENLRKKFNVVNYDGTPTIEKTAYRRNVASLVRKHSFPVMKNRYVDDTGESLIHLVEDCPRSYYLSYVVPKDSVYIDRLNTLIERLIEAGLPSLWNSVTTIKLIIFEIATANVQRITREHEAFDLHDMQTPFLLLSMGHAIAVCVLICEISYSKRLGGKRNAHEIRRKIVNSRNFVSQAH